MRFAASILIASVLAAPAMAFTPERAGIMVDAVRANGCSMVGQEAPGALEPLGLESVEVQTFVDVLYSAELVTLSDDMQTLVLSEALCLAEGDEAMAMIVAAFEAGETELSRWEPDFDPARGAELVGIIRNNDCGLSDEQAGEILPDQGFDPEITRDIVALMLETDLAEISNDGFAVTLSDALCSADSATDTATLTQAIADWTATNSVEGSE